MKNCIECKHWDCNSYVGDGVNIGLCSLFSDSEFALENTELLAQSICYGEGISGELITKSNFGCVSYEQKDSQSVVAKA